MSLEVRQVVEEDTHTHSKVVKGFPCQIWHGFSKTTKVSRTDLVVILHQVVEEDTLGGIRVLGQLLAD